MTIITLVGLKQAKKGYEFTYLGSTSDCKECRLKNVCFHLEEGRRYKIKGIRERQHDCKLHEKAVRVVEVEHVRIPVAIEEAMAVEGSTVTITLNGCNNISCKHYQLCNPPGLKRGAKFKVEEVKKGLRCSRGNKLKEVGVI